VGLPPVVLSVVIVIYYISLLLDVAESVWHFCRAAQFQVVGTAGAVAAGHREAFQRISIPGQGEDVAGNQGSAKVLTFNLSVSLLKRLISGSQSLYSHARVIKEYESSFQSRSLAGVWILPVPVLARKE
jgi:hypothetical protein